MGGWVFGGDLAAGLAGASVNCGRCALCGDPSTSDGDDADSGGLDGQLKADSASAGVVRRPSSGPFDIQFCSDSINAGTLLFDDGSTISVGSLPNGGGPLVVPVGKTTKPVTFAVVASGWFWCSGGCNNGLSEIEFC